MSNDIEMLLSAIVFAAVLVGVGIAIGFVIWGL